jgi:hypothetical protein
MTHKQPRPPDPESVERLVACFRSATAQDRADGATWYAAARAEAEHAAATFGCSVPAAAGVIAALSPLREWGANVADAWACIREHAAGRPIPWCHYADNLKKVARILAGEPPLDVLGGPKVRAFYAAIMGSPNAVTIDRWAQVAALGYRPGPTPSPAQYAALAATYTEAAARVGIAPAIFQATVWVFVRRAASAQAPA